MALPKTPTLRLDGRRALITGASRGLGLAAAAALAQAGAEVTLAARNKESLEEAVARLKAEGADAHPLPLDVTDNAQVKDTLGAEPAFHILVNNAGTNIPAPFTEVTEDAFDKMMLLNVRAAFFVAQAVARQLIAAGESGSIINMSSQMGHVGGRKRAVYCATKHAMEGFTKAMAWDLAEHKIRVNTICPTFMHTPLVEPMLQDKEFMQGVLAQIALGRIGEPQDIMSAIVFLASDGAALITGSALKIDGGWTAR